MNIYLQTDRIILREPVASDFEVLLQLDSDPEVMKFLTNGIPSTQQQIQNMMGRIRAELQETNGKYGIWMAIEKETEAFIGWFHLFPARDDSKNTKKLFLGYRLFQKYWGKGYATEVSIALVKKSFEELEATEVCAQAMKLNKNSQNVMKKVGMTFRHFFKEKNFPGSNQDAVLYSVKKVR